MRYRDHVAIDSLGVEYEDEYVDKVAEGSFETACQRKGAVGPFCLEQPG